MKINIANRYRPFFKAQKILAAIPSSSFQLEAYPAFLRVFDKNQAALEIQFDFGSPVEDFTLMQDIEKQRILLYGKAKQGFFRFSLSHIKDELTLSFDRGSFEVPFKIQRVSGLTCLSQPKACFKKKDKAVFKTASETKLSKHFERLSFGNHKKQDACLIKRRNDPKEFLPIWFLLGQLSQKDSSEQVEDPLQVLCQSYQFSFTELFAKSETPAQYLGFSGSFVTLNQGYQLIRRMIVEKQEKGFGFLLNLPSVFDAGRAMGFELLEGVTVDLEWSKKSIKKLILRSSIQKELTLSFKKEAQSLRLMSPSKKPQKKQLEKGELSLLIQPGITTLDQFKR